MQGSTRNSEGRRQLVDVLRGETTRGDVARRVQVSRKAVGYWVSGEKRPAYHARRELEQQYAIPMDAWDEPAALTPLCAKAA